MLLLTTSHRPSPRTRTFLKELISVLPGSYKINRGHKTLLDLAIEAKKQGLNYVAIISDRRGNPGSITLYEVVEKELLRPSLNKISTLILKGVKLSRENPAAGRIYGATRLNVDPSNCISDDCFYVADLLIKIFSKVLSEKPDITIFLKEDKYIALKFLNAHEKLVGPAITILRVL